MDKSEVLDSTEYEQDSREDGNQGDSTRGSEQDRRDMDRLGQTQQLDV